MRARLPDIIVTALVVLAMMVWAVATPRLSGPDEWDHVTRAANVVRGRVLPGDQIPGSNGQRSVAVPAVLVASDVACYAFRPTESAACQQYPDVSGTEQVASSAARYPPVPYVVVGLGSLISVSYVSLWTMRLLNAVVCGALIGLALAIARRTSGWMTLGVLGALTPMSIYIAGTVNPSGVEIAAAVVLWTALASRRADRLTIWSGVLSSVLLATARPLSFVWLAGIVGASIAAFGHRAVLAPYGRLARAAVVASVAAALWWFSISGLSGYRDEKLARNGALLTIAGDAFGNTGWWTRQMIGVFGYLDTKPHGVVPVLWVAALVALVAAAARHATPRARVALFGLAAAVVLVPVAADVQAARTLGFFWQGRYTLPLAVGLPILAAALLTHRGAEPRPGLVPTVTGGFVALHVVALYTALIRFTVGQGNGRRLWNGLDWRPPVPPLLLLAGYATALTAICLFSFRPGRADA